MKRKPKIVIDAIQPPPEGGDFLRFRLKMKDISKAIKKILETPFWPPMLNPYQPYFRTQDDCEGDKSEGISVTIGEDGDAWVFTNTKMHSCRYRMPFLGGGRSPRVRNALLILAMAIKMDNEEKL
jgi:hypothetical protein